MSFDFLSPPADEPPEKTRRQKRWAMIRDAFHPCHDTDKPQSEDSPPHDRRVAIEHDE